MFWYLKHVFSLLSRQWVQGWRRQTCALLAQIFTLRSPAQASDMQDMLQRETLHSDPTSSLLSSLHCASCLSLSLSPVSQKCPNVKFYNCYDWGLFWCKNDRKCQSLPHNQWAGLKTPVMWRVGDCGLRCYSWGQTEVKCVLTKD